MKRKRPTVKPATRSMRERIATALLFQRLGLEDDWQDPEFQILLPSRLPVSAERRIASSELREIEAGLRGLEVVGCRRPPLYWCLGQLRPRAESLRQGWQMKTVLHEDEARNREIPVKQSLATREDMASVARKLKSAADEIRKHRAELLLVADLSADVMPSSLLTEPETPEDALSLLLNSLYWAKRLANQWESPNASALMKSKGVLFFLAYVWVCTNADATSTKRATGRKATARSQPRYRLPRPLAQQMSEIIHAYNGVEYTADDLNDKLHDFATREPEAFSTLVVLLKKVHATASPAS